MNTIWSLPSPKGVWMHTCQAPGRISARESPSDPDAGAAASVVSGKKLSLRGFFARRARAFLAEHGRRRVACGWLMVGGRASGAACGARRAWKRKR